MPLLKTSHATIHFTDTGGDQSPIVLSHGFFMDGEMFTPQVDEFADEYRIITVDARRHGRTEDDGSAFTYWDLARDVVAVLDHLGIDSAVIGGMSQGGYIALRMALLDPSRVRALLLLDTEAASSTPEQKQMYRELFANWCSDAPLEPLAAMLAPQLIGGGPQDWEPWLKKWRASDRPAIAPAAECLIERDAVTDRLPEIEVPALGVRGELDGSAVEERAEELVAGLPNARPVVTVPGAGHAANWTHPEPVNAALREFLADIPVG
ncbi:alpha/beta fold hydrolase [Rhodococcus sp. NPDC058521]|uniref:alpha/beta fold hydrolase n=1 Tax=Rhodococcus sp. NPDC058521 TaxID=3346536 RepID=UPI00365D899D